MKDVKIREATPADAAMILDCLRMAFEPYRTRYTPEAFGDTILSRTRFSSASPPCASLSPSMMVAVSSGPSDGWRWITLRDTCVGWQSYPTARRGVAERLLHAAEGELISRKCSRITLDTTEPLLRAMRLYERHG